MANPTTNIGMTKPTVGGSTDTWGTTLNENVVDIIDALFSISGTDVTMSDIKFNSVGLQETGAGTDTVKVQAPAAVTQYTLTMPAAVGASGQILRTSDASGTLAWVTDEEGDLKSVADATNGGMTVTNGTGPDVTLAVNLNDLSAAAVNVANDSIAILDADDSSTKKESIADLATAMGGTGLTGASGTLAVNVAQTQITSVGTLTSLAVTGATTLGAAAATAPLTTWCADAESHWLLKSADAAAQYSWYLSNSGSDLSLSESGVGTVFTGTNALFAVTGAATVGGTLGVTGTITGNLTGNVTGNASGTAATVTGAAQSAITSVGTLTSLGVGAITSTGVFVTSSVGPHAIGGAASTVNRLGLLGSFTSSGSSNVVRGLEVGGALTGEGGNTARLVGTEFSNSIVTQTATESIAVIAQAYINEPGITDNLTGDITVASTVYIASAPTEGETNAALYIASGSVIALGTGPHAIGSTPDTRVQLNIAGAFTAAAVADRGIAVSIGTDLTGAAGQTNRLTLLDVGSGVGGSITTQSATEDIAVIATAYLAEPNITNNLGGSNVPDVAATVYVKDAPTEGTANAALYVASGDTVLKGNLGVGTTLRSDLHGAWSHVFLGEKGSLYSDNDTGAGGIDGMFLTDNLYLDSDTGAFAYIETNEASYIKQEAGVLTFANAASGTGGAAATLTTRFTVDAAGDVSLAATKKLYLDGGSDTYIKEISSDVIGFYTNGVNRLQIDNNGLIMSPTDKLYLDGGGDTYIHEASANAVQIVAGAAAYTLHSSGIEIPATKKLYLDGGSDTYIVENSANVIRCVAGGSGGVDLTSGATSWAAVSDVREKVESDFEPITDALTKVASLRSVIGRYTADSPDRRRAFLIGQDVQAVLPEAVTEDPDGVLSLAYTETIPLLVAALKEGSARIQALETALAAL